MENYIKYAMSVHLVLTEQIFFHVIVFFLLPDEKFGATVFKMRDCPRNVVNSATSRQGRPHSYICPEKCYIDHFPIQCNITKNNKVSHVFLSS